MKELIVTVGLTILGVFIFTMIMGPSENSIRESSKSVMEKSVEAYVEVE